MLFFGDNGVLEERTRALTIGIAGNDEHAFDGADVAHGLARLGEIGRGFTAFEVALEIGVTDARRATGCQGVGDAENDEPSALGSVEDAGPVGKSASFVAEFADLTVFQVENLHFRNGFGYFLAIGADVLYRRAAHAARNAAEALNPCAPGHHGVRYEPVPGFAGASVEKNFSVLIVPR